MTDCPPLDVTVEFDRKRANLGRGMLERSEESAHPSESESESMGVPGQGTPPSVGDKEEKIEVPGFANGKAPDKKSLEIEKEKPKPRASVLEYKSVSQMYVPLVAATHRLHEAGCLRYLQLGQRYLRSEASRLSGRFF